jgi:hypothetical protein
VPQIEVKFSIDKNGILWVKVKDKGTGKEKTISLSDHYTDRQQSIVPQKYPLPVEEEEAMLYSASDDLVLEDDKSLEPKRNRIDIASIFFLLILFSTFIFIISAVFK